MNPREFAASIQLHPRAALMHGLIVERKKSGGSLSGFTPHHTRTGAPPVQFNGTTALEEANAAGIEFRVMESGFPLPVLGRTYGKAQDLVQLAYGGAGIAPSQAAYRVLREASALLSTTAQAGKEVWIATVPVFSAAAMGAVAGRHCLVGVWNTDGTALWLNPEAMEAKVFEAHYPANQRERSTAASQAQALAAAPASSWYDTMRAALVHTGMKGKTLHNTIIGARANTLVEQGIAPDLKTGKALAQADYDASKALAAPAGATTPTSTPESSVRATGKAMLRG